MSSSRRSAFALVLGALALAFVAVPAGAQSWPQRPVQVSSFRSVPAPASTSPRGCFADKLSQKWGQPVVVENRPGGDAFVAIMAVVTAHDDHVLLFAPASTFTAHPLLHDTLPYKPDDLAPIARVTNTLIALGVPAPLGVATVKELAARIKAEPGKLNYASVTGANDLLFAAFLKTEKLDRRRCPTRIR